MHMIFSGQVQFGTTKVIADQLEVISELQDDGCKCNIIPPQKFMNVMDCLYIISTRYQLHSVYSRSFSRYVAIGMLYWLMVWSQKRYLHLHVQLKDTQVLLIHTSPWLEDKRLRKGGGREIKYLVVKVHQINQDRYSYITRTMKHYNTKLTLSTYAIIKQSVVYCAYKYAHSFSHCCLCYQWKAHQETTIAVISKSCQNHWMKHFQQNSHNACTC